MKYYLIKHYQGELFISNERSMIYLPSQKRWLQCADSIFKTNWYQIEEELKSFNPENIETYLDKLKLAEKLLK